MPAANFEWLAEVAKNAGALGSIIVLLAVLVTVLVSYLMVLRRSSRHESLDNTTYTRIISERDRAYQERDTATSKLSALDAENDQMRLQIHDLTGKLSKAEANETRLVALEQQVRHLSDELRKATDLITSQSTVITHMERMLQQRSGGVPCQP